MHSAQRLQLTSLKYTKGTSTLFNTTYSYTQNGGNNGQIVKITDLVDNGRTVDYTYDALGRLKTAVTVGSTAYPPIELQIHQAIYDRCFSSCVADKCR